MIEIKELNDLKFIRLAYSGGNALNLKNLKFVLHPWGRHPMTRNRVLPVQILPAITAPSFLLFSSLVPCKSSQEKPNSGSRFSSFPRPNPPKSSLQTMDSSSFISCQFLVANLFPLLSFSTKTQPYSREFWYFDKKLLFVLIFYLHYCRAAFAKRWYRVFIKIKFSFFFHTWIASD